MPARVMVSSVGIGSLLRLESYSEKKGLSKLAKDSDGGTL